ncbi:MAG: GTPase domain-containing protein [Verrucomicrobia bacterium]|nr:GTPase domain-containing protein [Verrucomicrobiota bacterium]
MSFVNFDKKEINFKIVYYGPPRGGKTTNLSHLHKVMPQEVRGDLTMLSTQQDRTLYFDFLPLQSTVIKGFISRFQLYTVPGQTIYDRTRQIVLTGADGVVFVADSQWEKMPENVESFENLEKNLGTHGRSFDNMPYILQFNKRDLEDIAPVTYMDYLFNHNRPRVDFFETVAVEGVGVDLTLNTICKMVMAKFIAENSMEIGLSVAGAAPANG